MSTLNVTRALTANTNPTENQFDLMRTYLLNFFNSANLDQTNVATGGMVYTSIGAAGDDAAMSFTSGHGIVKYVSASDYLMVQNTQGDLVWGTRSGATLTDAMRLDSATGNLQIEGLPFINTGLGSQEVSLMYLISRYRKPRLVYSTSDIVTVEDNAPTAGSPVVVARDRVWTIYDTTCSLAVDANGETSGDTGTAVSGRAAGISRTDNRWYYIYAVEVQYGTQATGVYCILVAHTTSPETANITTLNTAFGTGKWVYMGVVRNGYNDGTNGGVIVQFVYDAAGFIRFTHTTVDSEGVGVTMASTTGTTNLEYEIVIGNSAAATIPGVASRVRFGGHRESHGMELHYRNVSTDENHMITGGCYHTGSLSTLTPSVYFDVPLLSGYKLVVVVGNVSTDQRIVVAGFLDHFL